MKLIIAGGREEKLTQDHIVYLDDINTTMDITQVVSGGARGIDTDGEQWARIRNIPVKQFLPDYAKFKKGAPLVRNREMAEYADALAVFPGGKGTNHMYYRAKECGLTIFDFRHQSDH
jgi:hypothetical protein